jgi:hypothetical protein
MPHPAAGPQPGITNAGGGSGCFGGGCGTVFQLTPPAAGETGWTETVLYNFAGHADGAGADGDLIIDANGNLYGTTAIGGGPMTAAPCSS